MSRGVTDWRRVHTTRQADGRMVWPVHEEEMVDVQCWCRITTVKASRGEIIKGLTRTCGRKNCREPDE